MEGIFAKIETTKGEILIELEYKLAPGTVANFINLAQGLNENNYKELGEPFYNGLKFHRVIDDFMIQGGCPLGLGTGDPGYKFDDEFHKDLRHNREGTLSMANSGPNSNGSQFFITHIPTDWLDGKHTVFGYVKKGQDVVNQIKKDDIIMNIAIERYGEVSKKWDSVLKFKDFNSKGEIKKKEAIKSSKKAIISITEGMKKTKNGLYYSILKAGVGDNPLKGDNVSVHYTGSLVDGTVFDSSYQRNEPITFSLGIGQVIAGWDEGIMLLNKGSKARFVIPSNLAYGSQGAGGIIPPDATLIFEVELIEF